MEFHHLRTFVAVAEEGNLTRASERLFTSQPAVSAHVKALEEELGVVLFERTPKGMALTAAGNRLLAEAKSALDAVGRVSLTARSLQGRVLGTARIGLNTDSAYLRVTAFHEELAAAHPELRLELIQGITGCILDDIRDGRLDAGFFFGLPEHPEVTAHRLGEATMRVAAPAHWHDRVEGAPWSELARLPWIFPSDQCPYIHLMNALFPEEGPRPGRRLVASGESAMNALVRAGAGLTLIREDEAEAGLAEGSILLLPDYCYTLPLCFGHQARRSDDPMIEALLAAVQSVWRSAQPEQEAVYPSGSD